MASLLPLFILVPLVGFLISLLIPAHQENLIYRFTAGVVGTHSLGAVAFIMYWLSHGHPLLDARQIDLYQAGDCHFFIDYYFDKVSVAYLLVGALLTLMATIYSRYDLHRESGCKRFFNTVLLFFLGYNLVIFAGNLETTFIGWEILGIASFLLVAFYRDRYLSVKNAVKVFSIYRIGDVGMILAMWMSHSLWRENMTFYKLSNLALAHEHLQTHAPVVVFISLMILVAAAAKSAQLPFSTWLPHALEVSTPSSTILYGSLSVHIGILLLLRTMSFWEHQPSIRLMIGLLGLSTSIIAILTARVQSSVKSQIAYSSIAQVGLIFMEAAAGFEILALVHFTGNAFLRTYQLLVSPSVARYQIRAHFHPLAPRTRTIEANLSGKLALTVYMLSLKEWNLDSIMYRYLWNPMKWVGRKMDFMTVKWVLIIFIPGYLLVLFLLFNQAFIPQGLGGHLPAFFGLIGLLMAMKSFTERRIVWLSWLLVMLNYFWVALAVGFNALFSINQIYVYLGGVVVAGMVGFLCLQRLKDLEKDIDLDRFQGHVHKHPKIAFLFLIAGLGLAGFPITPIFIGEALIFTHIHEDQGLLALFTSLCFIIDGLAIVRIYARVFLGPHSESIYEAAYRSS